MDMRTGALYPDVATAVTAGVPQDQLVEVEPEIVRIVSGPFKGRVYRRTGSGLERLREREES